MIKMTREEEDSNAGVTRDQFGNVVSEETQKNFVITKGKRLQKTILNMHDMFDANECSVVLTNKKNGLVERTVEVSELIKVFKNSKFTLLKNSK